jgi:pimeloyl-ACP methyl ester carboxylesterase
MQQKEDNRDMKISKFKNQAARIFVEQWIDATIENSALTYQKLDIETSSGRTRVLAVNHPEKHLPSLIYIPGARTCGAFLNLSNQLQILSGEYRIYLLDVVGQIGMSDGNCPNLKDNSYGFWLNEVCQKLNVERAVFVGASFGGQIIIKLAAVAPDKIEKAVLMNPIGFSNISFAPLNLYRTIAPVIFPSRKTVDKFLKHIIFAPSDGITTETKKHVADFIENAVKNFQFAGEYPTKLNDVEIKKLTAETHLIVGESDGLIPFQKTIKRAKELLPNLKSVTNFPEQAHGIEVSSVAIFRLQQILKS